MDNAEQSPRIPSKGSFDTASLLAPSTGIYKSSSPSSVSSPLPHLTHSPSAFSVLGHNAVLVPPLLPPPTSSKSDVPSAKGGGKMCSPITHQSASDALSSLASSSSGSCGWWSASPPIVSTADFTGCGVTPIGDPFSRAGLCARPLAASHLSLPPQPRRIVEEVLGHLYAKPASAEFKVDSQTSGIHDTPPLTCKTKAALSPVDIQSPAQLNSLKTISPEKEFLPIKSDVALLSGVQNAVPSVMPVPSTSVLKSSQKKTDDTAIQPPPRIRKKRPMKSVNVPIEGIKNGKRPRVNNEHGRARTNRKPKEKTAKTLGLECETRGESSSGTSGVAGDNRSAGVSSSESTDEDERVKKQELARLKKQQKKLERKVQKLEQASSHDSNLQKSEVYNKKASAAPKAAPSPKAINHSKKPIPSPAHSSSTLAVSPKATPLKPKSNSCMEEDANMSVPLDLCVKKTEPTFEVSSSSFHSSFSPLLTAMKKQVHMPTFGQPMDHKYPLSAAPPKRRGRKPKYLSTSNISPEIAHQFKQNNVRDLSTVLLPQKLLPSIQTSCRNSDMNSFKKSINSSSTPKSSLLVASDLANPLNIPRKNFTLDSLLGESNGNIDSDNNLDFSPSSSFADMSLKGKDRLRYSNRIKRIEERNRDFETLTKADSSSATDSDPDNDQTDSDESISGNVSTTAGNKRSYDEDGEEFGNKRRRVVPDEREIQIPLEHGWRRETKIRCFSRAGVRGEVTYYTPCGKKLRSYPEVVRYLIRNGITDISRDNFTFSTKVNVGDFLEVTSTGAGEEYVLLSEQEVLARINEVRSRKGRLGVQYKRSSHQRCAEQEEQQRLWEQKQLQHQLEQQAEEVRRQKEQQRILKQQERFERLEQLRIEREIRAQHALEEQEIKRQQQAFLREQEMEKRREVLLMVDLERERRRQHMMLVRALETRKKQEERERKREEIMYEKRVNREKKMEQRRIELDYLRELKKPVEDMMLKDNAPFPEFNRIKGIKLAGKDFGDLLMVFEFLHNFGETLGFDVENLPSLNTLQSAVLNLDEKHEEELLSVTHHLLACVIEDPGVPHCPEASTVLGQNLKDADITNNNVSEVLRLYFTAVDKRSNMCHWLQSKPFLCLNASQKVEILAYVCDDLLGSRVLMRKIDSNIESVNVLRKDKWLIEGDLRRLKTVQQRRLLKAKQQTYEESKQTTPGNNSALPSDGSPSKDLSNSNVDNSDVKDMSECDKDKLDDLDNDNESGNESEDERNDSQGQILLSDGDDEDLQLSNEELTKKVDKLSKQLTCYSNKLTKALHTIRAVTFGQDRFHRRYWVLPKAGGVYVESMESSELPHDAEEILAASEEGDSEKTSIAESNTEIKNEVETSQDTKELITAIDEPAKEENGQTVADEKETVDEEPVQEEKPEPVEVKKEADVDDPDIKSEVGEVTEVKEVSSPEEVVVKSEVDESTKSNSIVVNTNEVSPKKAEAAESMDLSPEPDLKKENSIEKVSRKNSKEKNGAIDKGILDDFSDSKKDRKSDVNIFMPKFCDNVGMDNCPPMNHTITNSADRKQPLNPSVPTNPNWLLHSPFFASLLAGNLMFNGPMMPGREPNGTYFNLPKNDFNNPFGPFLGTPNMMTPEQIYKQLSEKPNNQKPWFSILPRMPCDEESMPKSQLAKHLFGSQSMFTPPNLFAPNMNSGKVPPTSHSPSTSTAPPPPGSHLSNLQMEILNGMPPGFFLHPFIPHQFGPTYPGGMPVSSSSTSTFTPTPSHSSPMTDFNFNLGRPPASSTPSSIPTPSATPGPSQGCSTPTFRDSPTPSIKKLMIEKLTQEYDKPKPIPKELLRSWWRIVDSTQLKDLVNSLHHRGIREKMLQKFLQKHFNYACNSCSQGLDDGVKFEETELDEEIAKLPEGVPVPSETDSWSRDVALRVDLSILEQIENLEEKIDGASMQVKGWKPTPKISVDGFNKFVPTCELYLQLQVKCDIPDSPREKSPKKSGKKTSARKRRSEAKRRALEAAELAAAAKAEEEAEAEDKPEESVSDKMDDSLREIMPDEKEKIIEEPEPEKEADDFLPPGKMNPVEEAKKRLLMVEAAIERRYLKPPLGFSANELNRSALSGTQPVTENGEEDNIPFGLLKWRNAVQVCRSSSQLAMCLNYLENFTAWDKSIMRASCQFCHSGENEEMLLLCDGCDKGYHTYCFKPKMEKIPEGDWYCYECLNKATGDNVCVICGKKGKLIDCGACPKCFHLSCLDPPLSKMPKAKWYCSGCSQSRPVKKSSKKAPANKDKEKEAKEPASSKKAEPENKPAKPKGGEKKERKKEKPVQITEDFAPCKNLVIEMEKHDDSWPFLSPVNTKQFPTYRKVIKKSMDLATVHGRLDANQYKSREDFANDVRLIFDNCETFNEDDSPVGQAGHTMRAFFDTRWTEMCNT